MLTRLDYLQAVLAASDGRTLSPVQVQKLLFLLDRKASALIGGPRYVFAAYDYGPFDRAVYDDLRLLRAAGAVEIEAPAGSNLRLYRPTPTGLEQGRAMLDRLGPAAAGYVREMSKWVRSQSFAGLVSAVYREFPEMRANSVFKG